MPYIGRPLNAGNLAVQSGTGDGSDTTPIATLDYSVGSSNSIGVYLDGVRQLAGTDFTASGTVLTFTTAPANGVGIDVYFLGLELSIPTPADATVTAAKIASNAVTTAKIIANAVDETKLKDALVADFTEVVVTASDSILLGDATDSGNTKRDTVQGILDLATVTDSKFLAHLASTQSNKTGDGTVWTATGAIWTEVFDTGSNFVNGTFTAPVDGVYCFGAYFEYYGILSGHTIMRMHILASGVSYRIDALQDVQDAGQRTMAGSCLVSMDASDTAVVTILISGSTKVIDFTGTADVNGFYGFLLA